MSAPTIQEISEFSGELLRSKHGPMPVGQRTHKAASLRVAVAECLPDDMREMTREILSLASSNPRKGHASTLLWTVCHEADVARVTLILRPVAFGDGMTDEQLEKFYAKFGFTAIQREPCVLMARSPERVRRVVMQ